MIAFFPFAILKNAQFLKQLPDINRLGPGNRNVMRRPRVRGDFVFTPARISAGPVIHLEENEVRETFLLKPPRRAEAGNSPAYNNHGALHDLLRCRKAYSIAQLMADLEGVVHERAGKGLITFGR